MSVCLQNLAGIKYATAKYGEARDLYEQVLGLKKRTYGEKQGGDSIGLFRTRNWPQFCFENKTKMNV